MFYLNPALKILIVNLSLWLNKTNQVRNIAYTPTFENREKELLKALSQGFKKKGKEKASKFIREQTKKSSPVL